MRPRRKKVDAKPISVTIAATPEAVYSFASDPRNLPKWAAGLCRSVKQVGGVWVGEGGPGGRVRIDIVEPNHLGILDHMVTLSSGERIMVPIRVTAKGKGSEVTLTLLRIPGMSDRQMAADARLIRKDLAALKKAIEN